MDLVLKSLQMVTKAYNMIRKKDIHRVKDQNLSRKDLIYTIALSMHFLGFE